MTTQVKDVKLRSCSYETTFLEVSDPHGNRVVFGPSRVTVEPMEFRRKSNGERIADILVKGWIVVTTIYFFAQIARCFADGAFKGLSL